MKSIKIESSWMTDSSHPLTGLLVKLTGDDYLKERVKNKIKIDNEKVEDFTIYFKCRSNILESLRRIVRRVKSDIKDYSNYFYLVKNKNSNYLEVISPLRVRGIGNSMFIVSSNNEAVLEVVADPDVEIKFSIRVEDLIELLKKVVVDFKNIEVKMSSINKIAHVGDRKFFIHSYNMYLTEQWVIPSGIKVGNGKDYD